MESQRSSISSSAIIQQLHHPMSAHWFMKICVSAICPIRLRCGRGLLLFTGGEERGEGRTDGSNKRFTLIINIPTIQ